MSTKESIFYREIFHLYKECFDEAAIYLEGRVLNACLETSDGQSRLMVRIPTQVWEIIRRHSEMDNLVKEAGRSDGELHDLAENFVKTRLEMSKDSMNRVSGIAVYGSPDDPFENQIEKGVAHLLEKRQRARNLLQAIEKFPGINQ